MARRDGQGEERAGVQMIGAVWSWQDGGSRLL